MTDVSDTPTTIRRLPSFPKLAVGATLNAMANAMSDALKMAYVDPYAGHHRPPAVPDDDLDGRDPNW